MSQPCIITAESPSRQHTSPEPIPLYTDSRPAAEPSFPTHTLYISLSLAPAQVFPLYLPPSRQTISSAHKSPRSAPHLPRPRKIDITSASSQQACVTRIPYDRDTIPGPHARPNTAGTRAMRRAYISPGGRVQSSDTGKWESFFFFNNRGFIGAIGHFAPIRKCRLAESCQRRPGAAQRRAYPAGESFCSAPGRLCVFPGRRAGGMLYD